MCEAIPRFQSVVSKKKKEEKAMAELSEIEKLKRGIETLESLGEMGQAALMREKLKALETRSATQASAPGKEPEVATSPLEERGELITDYITDIAKFKEAGKYELHAEGNFRTKLVSSFVPDTEKPQRWFVMETDDERLKVPNRGVYVGEYGRGSGIYRGILDGLGVDYTFNERTGELSYRLNYPILCWADWSRDAKGIGGIRISGISQEKPEQAL